MASNRYVQLDPAVIEQARQIDLLSYLQRYEPGNLKRVAGNVYCTKEHDSLKISNGKWYWWSRGIGGYSALDYLMKVRELGFVGKDESGKPKYAALRSTLGSSFRQDASGSDKRYSFRLLAREPMDKVHLFEAAIDLLSYATYLKCEGKDYKAANLLSLSGVYQPKKELSESKIPIALSTYLQKNPQIKTVILHLDNDRTGRLCTAALKELLQKDYKIVDAPPPVGKDVNDFLMSYLGIARQKSSRERGDAR